MSDELLNALIGVVLASLPVAWTALINSRWWAQSVPWIAKKLSAVIAYAVAKVFREYVDDLMAAKALKGDSLDLQTHEAQEALDRAETTVRNAAEAAGIGKALPAPEILQGMIQQEVTKQKAVKRATLNPSGKGFR